MESKSYAADFKLKVVLENVLPLLVDVALLWFVFGQRVTVDSLRG